jgi:hypothetical protein
MTMVRWSTSRVAAAQFALIEAASRSANQTNVADAKHERSLNTAEAGAFNIFGSKIALRASPVTRQPTKRVYTFDRADDSTRAGFIFIDTTLAHLYRYFVELRSSSDGDRTLFCFPLLRRSSQGLNQQHIGSAPTHRLRYAESHRNTG